MTAKGIQRKPSYGVCSVFAKAVAAKSEPGLMMPISAIENMNQSKKIPRSASLLFTSLHAQRSDVRCAPL